MEHFADTRLFSKKELSLMLKEIKELDKEVSEKQLKLLGMRQKFCIASGWVIKSVVTGKSITHFYTKKRNHFYLRARSHCTRNTKMTFPRG